MSPLRPSRSTYRARFTAALRCIEDTRAIASACGTATARRDRAVAMRQRVRPGFVAVWG
jgi:predicted component of type VI protein secretion system